MQRLYNTAGGIKAIKGKTDFDNTIVRISRKGNLLSSPLMLIIILFEGNRVA
jgi:hypothetical protein